MIGSHITAPERCSCDAVSSFTVGSSALNAVRLFTMLLANVNKKLQFKPELRALAKGLERIQIHILCTERASGGCSCTDKLPIVPLPLMTPSAPLTVATDTGIAKPMIRNMADVLGIASCSIWMPLALLGASLYAAARTRLWVCRGRLALCTWRAHLVL